MFTDLKKMNIIHQITFIQRDPFNMLLTANCDF